MKLIAIDLNGTLLNRRNQISRKNIEAIKTTQKKGIEIAIVTGRAHFDVQSILKNAGISAWIIGTNGATIHDKKGTLLHAKSIKKDDAKEILDYFVKHNMYYEVFSDQVIYTPKNGRDLLTIEMFKLKNTNPKINLKLFQEAAERQYSQGKFEFISSHLDIIDKTNEFYNLLGFSFYREKINDGWQHFEQKRELATASLAKHLFELTHSDVSKGCAVRYLSGKLNIQREDIIAIGDHYNDLPMFESAGLSIAMGNSVRDIKSCAHHVTLSNDEDGVAHVMKQLI